MPPKKKPIKRKRKPKPTQEQKQTQKIIVNIGNIKKPVKKRRRVAAQKQETQRIPYQPFPQVRFIIPPEPSREPRDRLSNNLISARREHGEILEAPPSLSQPQMMREPQRPVEGKRSRSSSASSVPSLGEAATAYLTEPLLPVGLSASTRPLDRAMSDFGDPDAPVPDFGGLGYTGGYEPPTPPPPPTGQGQKKTDVSKMSKAEFTAYAASQGDAIDETLSGNAYINQRKAIIERLFADVPRGGRRL